MFMLFVVDDLFENSGSSTAWAYLGGLWVQPPPNESVSVIKA